MGNLRSTLLSTALFLVLLICCSPFTAAHVPAPITVGQRGTEPFGYSVRWTQTGPGEGHWALEDSSEPQYLITDPTASPMRKQFQLPVSPRPIDGLQLGWTASVSEYFFVSDGTSLLGTDIPQGRPITEWNALILTPGWEWVIPLPESSDAPLITHDGLPWDWEYTDREPKDWESSELEPSSERAWLSVGFSAIEPGELFVVRKQLRWIGTRGNTVYGDQILDDGSRHFERPVISVIEYPTVVPEPATFSLAIAATFCFVGRRRPSTARGTRVTRKGINQV